MPSFLTMRLATPAYKTLLPSLHQTPTKPAVMFPWCYVNRGKELSNIPVLGRNRIQSISQLCRIHFQFNVKELCGQIA